MDWLARARRCCHTCGLPQAVGWWNAWASLQLQIRTRICAAVHGRFSETLLPDVWFDAKTVWEVKCADFSISPRHKAALGLADPDKGISIRFPRLVKVRDDKSPEDATSAEQARPAPFPKSTFHLALLPFSVWSCPR